MQRVSRFELTATVISVSMFAESEQRRDRREPNSENACVLGVRMEQRKAHPIADIFPIMTEEETNDLANDVLLHGQREPIWMYEGKILDGRNRHNACLLKGLEPRMADYDGSDPVAFAVSMNLKRRQLDDAQRSVIAAKLATYKRGDNQHVPIGGTSQAEAAQMLNVSKRRVQRARKLIEDGTPQLVKAVERGDVKVSAAAEFAKCRSPLDQAKLIDDFGSAAAVKATIKAKADRAARKIQKSVPDPKRAADRADRISERWRCLSEMLQRYFALESSGTPSQVANAVRRSETSTFQRDTIRRLGQVVAFVNELVILLGEANAPAKDSETATAAK